MQGAGENSPARVPILKVGTYESTCLYKASFGYYKLQIEVTETHLNKNFIFYSGAGCGATYYSFLTQQKIEKPSFESETDDQILLVDVSIVDFSYVWNHSWYVNQNYCGVGWVLNVRKSIVGIHCPQLTGRSDGVIRGVGHKVYLRMKVNLDENTIAYPHKDDVIGDSENDRLGASESDLFSVVMK